MIQAEVLDRRLKRLQSRRCIEFVQARSAHPIQRHFHTHHSSPIDSFHLSKYRALAKGVDPKARAGPSVAARIVYCAYVLER